MQLRYSVKNAIYIRRFLNRDSAAKLINSLQTDVKNKNIYTIISSLRNSLTVTIEETVSAFIKSTSDCHLILFLLSAHQSRLTCLHFRKASLQAFHIL